MFADFRKQAKGMDEILAALNKVLAGLGEFPPEESMADSDRLYYGFLQGQVEMIKLLGVMAVSIKYMSHNMARFVDVIGKIAEKMKEGGEVTDSYLSDILDKVDSFPVSADRLARLEEKMNLLEFDSVKSELQGRN